MWCVDEGCTKCDGNLTKVVLGVCHARTTFSYSYSLRPSSSDVLCDFATADYLPHPNATMLGVYYHDPSCSPSSLTQLRNMGAVHTDGTTGAPCASDRVHQVQGPGPGVCLGLARHAFLLQLQQLHVQPHNEPLSTLWVFGSRRVPRVSVFGGGPEVREYLDGCNA